MQPYGGSSDDLAASPLNGAGSSSSSSSNGITGGKGARQTRMPVPIRTSCRLLAPVEDEDDSEAITLQRRHVVECQRVSQSKDSGEQACIPPIVF